MSMNEETPLLSSESPHLDDICNIVILGGNFAGVSIAHYLLRHVLPALNSMDGTGHVYKVTLVSPSTHWFFKVGAPRALTSAEAASFDQSFYSIAEVFKNYNSSYFTFIQGEATGIDESAQRVVLKRPSSELDSDLRYDSLVIATGTTSRSPLWTLHGDYTITRSAFEDLHTRLPKAKKIVIAGAGASGVETAGEIAYRYKDRDITILSGATRLLPNLKNTSVSAAAQQHLDALNVHTVHGIRVSSSTETADGKTVLEYSNGTTEEVDVYIDATGGKPNSGFLPRTWLDERKYVVTDGTTLRALKAPTGVYCIGDVASYSKGGILDVEYAIPPLGYSIWFDLYRSAAAAQVKDVEPIGTVTTRILKEKKYKQIQSDMQFVPIGPQGGVGSFFGWRVPSWVVWLLKSRTMFFEKAPGIVGGAWAH